MIQKIYKLLRDFGFTSKGQDKPNNERLGIRRTFSDEMGRYVEIYNEDYGFSIFIYGTGFMRGYFRYRADILNTDDISLLEKKLKTTINNP